MNIRCFFVLLLLCICQQQVFAKQKEFEEINQKFWSTISNSPDSAMQYAYQGIELSKKDSTSICSALNNLGIYHYYTDHYDSALHYYRLATKVAEKTSDSLMIAKLYNNSAIIYDINGKYNEAIKDYSKSLQIHKKLNNWHHVAETYSNLGIVQKLMGNYQKATSTVKRSIAIHDSLNNTESKAYSLSTLALIYQEKGELKKSVELHQKAKDLFKQEGFISEEANEMLNLATIYSSYGALDLSLKLLTDALDKYESINQPTGVACCLLKIAKLQQINTQTEEAIANFEKARKLFNENQFLLKELDATLELAALYCALDSSNTTNELTIAAEQIVNSMQSPPNYARLQKLKGEIEQKRENYTNALQHFSKALEIYEDAQLYHKSLAINMSIAETHYLNNQLESSIALAEKVYDKSRNDSLLILQNAASKLLYKCYEEAGNYPLALSYLKKYQTLNNQLNSHDHIRKITAFQIRNEYEKKLLEEKHLATQNELALQTKIEYKQKQIYLLCITVFIIFISILIVFKLLYQAKKAHQKLAEKNYELTLQFEKKKTKRTRQSKLKDNEKKLLLKSLKKLMDKEQVYLQADLKISDLSKLLNTNNNYLSNVINEAFEKNFNQYINDYRVKHACMLFHNGEHLKHSIEGISTSVGFNNRATFIASFKKYTGLTPSFYIRSLTPEN